jgi:hypothetical protein
MAAKFNFTIIYSGKGEKIVVSSLKELVERCSLISMIPKSDLYLAYIDEKNEEVGIYTDEDDQDIPEVEKLPRNGVEIYIKKDPDEELCSSYITAESIIHEEQKMTVEQYIELSCKKLKEELLKSIEEFNNKYK